MTFYNQPHCKDDIKPDGQHKKVNLTYCDHSDATALFKSYRLRDDLTLNQTMSFYNQGCGSELREQISDSLKGCYEALDDAYCVEITMGWL